MLAFWLRLALVLLGLLDLMLIAWSALPRAINADAAGRLIMLCGLIGGLLLASSGRLIARDMNPPSLVLVGDVLMDVCLLGLAIFLRDRSVLTWLRERRRR